MTGLVLGVAVLAVVVVMGVAAGQTRRLRRIAVVDAAWGFAYVTLTVAVAVVVVLGEDATSDSGPGVHRWLRWVVVAMVAVWGLRLGTHLWRRVVASREDDPRYEDLLGGGLDSIPFGRVLTKVYGLQAVIVLVVAVPVLVVMLAEPRHVWPAFLGVPLWALGVGLESAADRQLAAYRADPERPRLLTTGVWSWSRHPNYFGDTCVWWGIWLASAATCGWPGAVIGLVGPVVMTWFLIAVSGVRLAERRMADRPGWPAYVARTSIFVPMPPRR
ncbi:DUF1295 domain-containing protein [Nocardioides sp.]|uniref:DUF1295 domain-containing protein n=1 Tax=Nocardioides sp. TaxID=35761 RepID=UPI0026161C95|nr:DUF1295 domain-containing protein [Nocardioides sp.]